MRHICLLAAAIGVVIGASCSAAVRPLAGRDLDAAVGGVDPNGYCSPLTTCGTSASSIGQCNETWNWTCMQWQCQAVGSSCGATEWAGSFMTQECGGTTGQGCIGGALPGCVLRTDYTCLPATGILGGCTCTAGIAYFNGTHDFCLLTP